MLFYPHNPCEDLLCKQISELDTTQEFNYFCSRLAFDYYFQKSSRQLIQDIINFSSFLLSKSIKYCAGCGHESFIRYLSIFTLAKNYDLLSRLFRFDDNDLYHFLDLECPGDLRSPNSVYLRVCTFIIRDYHQSEIEKVRSLIVEFRNILKISPETKRRLGTLIELIEGIINQDNQQIEQSIMARQEAFLRAYKRGENRHSLESLLDINGLGILARGYQDYQLNTEVETVYLPKSLWRI